jgi:exodeoxyribonuclease VII large subunit
MEQAALFAEERTWRVGELAAALTRAVAAAFPSEVWVRGEIDGLRPPTANGHVYFTLCERNSRRGPTSTLSVSLFRQDRLKVERELRNWPELRLANGLEVRLRGRVQFGYGRLHLVMAALDPVHTLGRLAADRERVLRALAADGLLEANRRLPLPAVPLHVGLVTSAGSAACEDVLSELRASGLGFRVSLTDAVVQGTGAVPSLLRALARQARLRPDVVLVVRGGGPRTDLATFDSEALARGIAGTPVPVLTGIGHEIDTTVADEVAHTSFKTPTAAAAAVGERVHTALGRAEAAWTGVARRAGAAVATAGSRLDERAGRLVRTGSAALAGESGRLDRRAGAVGVVARSRLRHDEAELTATARRLVRAAGGAVAGATSHLDVLAARTAAVDPARTLARGWSVTRDARGRLVRRAGDVRPGDRLVTVLAEGTLESTVEP